MLSPHRLSRQGRTHFRRPYGSWDQGARVKFIQAIIMSLTSNALLLVLFVLSVIIKRRLDKEHLDDNPRHLGYPPGPKNLPVIGNAFDFPTTTPWITYTRWAEQYGTLPL